MSDFFWLFVCIYAALFWFVGAWKCYRTGRVDLTFWKTTLPQHYRGNVAVMHVLLGLVCAIGVSARLVCMLAV